MADWTDLKEFVSAGNGKDDFVQSCYTQAAALVTNYNKAWDSDLATYVPSAAPDEVVDRAVLNVGAELYHAKDAKNGISQFASFDGANAARIARDPMVAAYALLAPWVVSGF